MDFWNRSTIHTNLVPERLFGEATRLVWDHLRRIIEILEHTNIEGMRYTPEEMRRLQEVWDSRQNNIDSEYSQ